MTHHVADLPVHTQQSQGTFFALVKKNFLLELYQALSFIKVTLIIVSAFLFGLIEHLFSFEEMKAFSKIFFPPFIVYWFGEHLTPISHTFVIVMMLATVIPHPRIRATVWGILFFAMIVGFFSSVLI